MAAALVIALAGTITDDKGFIHGGVGNEQFRLDLDAVAAKLGIPVLLVVEAMQDQIDKADMNDTTPGDGMFEAGIAKSFKIKADFLFIHLRDNIKAEAAIVAKIEA